MQGRAGHIYKTGASPPSSRTYHIGGEERPVLPIVTQPMGNSIECANTAFPTLSPGVATGGLSALLVKERSPKMFAAKANSLPPKLSQRILAREFIDMRELLPESWRTDSQQAGSTPKGVARGPIRDLKLWAECFAVLAGVLVMAYPEKAHDLMGYLRLMTRASQNYDTDAWVEYDTSFRRRAGNSGSLDWGSIDATLYNEIFTGRAKAVKLCSYCVVDTHSLEEWVYAPKGWTHREGAFPPESRPRGSQRPQGIPKGGSRPESGSIEVQIIQ